MKSRFGTVRIETARQWTLPELYLVLCTHKGELSSPPELRNYGKETGLYMDTVGIYTLSFLPEEVSDVTLKLWCPWQELRIAPPRRGSVDSSYPGKAEATPILENTADAVSRILREAEAQNLTFDTSLVPPEGDWGLPFRAWLPLEAATWTGELSVTFVPPLCLSQEEQMAILCRCPGNLSSSDVVFYVESWRFLRQNDVFVVTTAGIFGYIDKPFSMVFSELASAEADFSGRVTFVKTSGQTEIFQLGRFGKALLDIAQKAAAYNKTAEKEDLQ